MDVIWRRGSGAALGALVKTGKQEGWLRVWAIGSGTPPAVREVTNVHLEGEAYSVAFDPESRYLAATCLGTARVFRIPSGREEWRVEREAAVEGIAFSPDGKHLAYGVFNGYAYVYDLKTRQLAGTVRWPGRWRAEGQFHARRSALGNRRLG